MTGRSPFSWRHCRWAALATALPVLWACNARRLEKPNPQPMRVQGSNFQETLNRDLDILFMVDNSQSMQPLISKLATNFPAFITVLQQLPDGLPNLHMAVVSSNMGAGLETRVGHCPQGGDGGAFQDMIGIGTMKPGGTPCVGAGTGLATNQHYISNAGGTTNYTGDISDVFSCIAQLGDEGCGFEHQLASVARALSKDDLTSADGNPVPAVNVGFLRRNAYLAIVLITNEDDCSAPPNSDLFNANSQFTSDPLGPLWSYRCNEFGHLCNGAAPSRTQAYSYGPGECVPAEEAGQLIPIHTIVDQIKSLKDDPSTIFVAAIAGPPDPYSMTPIPAQNTDQQMWANIDHSCSATDGTFGDPSIRIKAFVDAFGGNGLFQTICANSFAPALTLIADTLGKVLGPKCVVGQLLDKNGVPTDVGNNADCSVVERSFSQTGTEIQKVVPPCPTRNADGKCWNLEEDAACPSANAPSHLLSFDPPPDPTVSGLNALVSCAIAAQ